MAKTEFIRARIDEDLKENSEKLFKEIGLSMTEAITIFLTQCQLQHGLPFEVKIPNAETRQAIEDVHAGRNIESFNDVEEMFRELDI